jgi:hypothetical protein
MSENMTGLKGPATTHLVKESPEHDERQEEDEKTRCTKEMLDIFADV